MQIKNKEKRGGRGVTATPTTRAATRARQKPLRVFSIRKIITQTSATENSKRRKRKND